MNTLIYGGLSMIHLKPVAVIVGLITFVAIMIPSLLVLPFKEESRGGLKEELNRKETWESGASSMEVSVFRSNTNEIMTLPLEEYIVGVVAGEMPAEFELEALKAQSLAARTYIINHLLTGDLSNVPEGADVTDTENHQVYKSEEELRRQWGKDYQWKIDKIREAVEATKGQIITYNNEPIYAAFFSTSNGYTENSEDYWSSPRPYLKSVESPWDVNTEKFKGQEVFSIDEVEKLLGVQIDTREELGKIIERTDGNRVGKVEIGGKIFTGKEVREKLGLKSSDFTMERKEDYIVVYTKGYGHGVGMSQYGANEMAKAGKTYVDIIQYYYQGVTIEPSTKILAQK